MEGEAFIKKKKKAATNNKKKRSLTVLRDKKSKWKSASSHVAVRPALKQAFRGSDTLHMERDLPPSVGLESKIPFSYPLLLTLLLLSVLLAEQSPRCIQMSWLKKYLE